MAEPSYGRVIGRYALFDVLAAGGMATVHIGRLLGPVGFARTVAIKRLHPQFAADPEFVSMFLDEARMCARIRHPNVVPTLDVVAAKGELFLVMEYVQGESLGHLLRSLAKRNEAVPWRVAISILAGTLHGLHAAHEAKDERGIPLGLVHRDVSPQNILVGSDGMARVVDFGIAKASGRIHVTREGAVKGKVGYMAPEQMAAETISRQADVYAASAVLWEALAGRRLFDGESEAVILARVLTAEIKPPSSIIAEIPPLLDELVLKGLARPIEQRFASAREMALALEKLGPATAGEVSEWLEQNAGAAIEGRARQISLVENGSGMLTPATVGQRDEPAPPGERAADGATRAPSGSIRPTARSEANETEQSSGAAVGGASSRWKPLALAAGAGLLGVGVWLAVGASRPDAASLSPSSTANGGAAAAATPSTSSPVRVPAAATGTETVTLASTGTAPSASASAIKPALRSSATPPSRPVGPAKVPTKDPFNLGGRN